MIRVRFGDVTLDEARFELRRAGEVVAVQPKVLELIVYLVRHRQRVVPTEELMSTVWDGTVVTEASLSQALSLARRALGDSAREQKAIRTVRRKGLQFVARLEGPSAPQRGASQRAARETVSGATVLETVEAPAEARGDRAITERLTVVIHGDAPRQGGGSYGLQDVDEVWLVRGSKRSADRRTARRLVLSLPGSQMSRRHARLVRVPEGWVVVDDESRNGTFVDGVRVSKHAVTHGCSVECGETLLCFFVDEGPAAAPVDVESAVGARLLTTVDPRLFALDHALQQIAPTALPVLITGPSGAGKSHLAEVIHHASGCSGAFIRLEASIREPETIRDRLKAAADGSLVVENLERFDAASASVLASMLEEAPSARVIGTSCVPFASLQGSHSRDVVTKLSGYRCALPSLVERRGDVGTLAAATFGGLGVEGAMTAEAMRALFRHDWPGNLRELVHTLQAAARLAGASRIGVEHLPPELT